MDLRRIEYLIAVAGYGSFSKAATVVGVAQPALGRQVRKLEHDCGVQLLYRHGRGVALTPDGQRFIERVQPIVQQLHTVSAEFRHERQAPAGSVIVGMTPTAANLLGLRLLTATREKYPKLQLNIVSAYSGYIHEWLIDARVDLAIVLDAPRPPQIAVERLADARLSLVSARALAPRAPNGEMLEFQRLSALPLALPSGNHGLRRTLERAAKRAGVSLDVQYEIDTISLLKQLVLAGAAHTVLPVPAAQPEIGGGKLVARQIANPPLAIRLSLAKAAGRPFTRAVRVTEQEIKELLRRTVLEASVDLGVSLA
jgi:LysR family transcriptional regulator, nitrogen assimilation regulatory protein